MLAFTHTPIPPIFAHATHTHSVTHSPTRTCTIVSVALRSSTVNIDDAFRIWRRCEGVGARGEGVEGEWVCQSVREGGECVGRSV